MIFNLIKKILFYFNIIIIILLLLNYGWNKYFINNFIEFGIFFYVTILLIIFYSFLFFLDKKNKKQINYFLLILTIPLLLICITIIFKEDQAQYIYIYKKILIINLVLYIFIYITKFIRYLYVIINNPMYIFIITFLLLDIIGALLLIIPGSTNKNNISPIDALFTSTSAICVTGLSVLDIENFTIYGKTIILLLIELGGLGVLTVTSFISYFFYNNFPFKESIHVKKILNSDSLNNIMNLAVKIVFITIIIEFIGFLMIFFSVKKSYIKDDLIFFSLFHSISSFCNAGFSTINEGLYSKHIRYNYLLQIIISFISIIGGIGFYIIFNIYEYIKINLKKISNRIFFKKNSVRYPIKIITLNTKIVLITTISIIFIGTLFFYILERNNALHEHNSTTNKIISSFFLSVSFRSVGFQTIDIKLLYPFSILFTTFIMFIGSSPVSTGGGIKTSVFAISILNIFSIYKGDTHIEIQEKRISNRLVKKSFAILTISLLIINISTLIISIADRDKDFLTIYFEVISAFSTVGISLGITSKLTIISKLILIILMLFGRIGVFNIIIGVSKIIKPKHYKFPKEIVLIN